MGGINYFVGGELTIPANVSPDTKKCIESLENIVCTSKNTYDALTSHINAGVNWNGMNSIRIIGPGQARRKWTPEQSNTQIPGSDCHESTKNTLVGSYSQDGRYTFLLDTIPDDWSNLVEIHQLENAIQNWLSCLISTTERSEASRKISIVMTHDFITSKQVPIHQNDDVDTQNHPCHHLLAASTKTQTSDFEIDYIDKHAVSVVPKMIIWVLQKLDIPAAEIKIVRNPQVWMIRNLPQIPKKTYPYSLACRPGEISLSQEGWTLDDGRLLSPQHIAIIPEKDKGVLVSKPSIFSDGHVEFSITTSCQGKIPVKVYIRAIFSSKEKISHHLEISGHHLGSQDDIMEISRHSLDSDKAPENTMIGSHQYLHRLTYVDQHMVKGFVMAKNLEKNIREASPSDKETTLISSYGISDMGEFLFVPNKINQYLKEVDGDERKCDFATKQFFSEMEAISIDIRQYWYQTLSGFQPRTSYFHRETCVAQPMPSMMRQVSSFNNFH